MCPTPGFWVGFAGESMWISARMAVERSGRPSPRLQKILSFEFSEVSVGASGRDRVHKRFCRRRSNHMEQERRVASATRAGEEKGGQSVKCCRRRRRRRVKGRPGPMLSWRTNPNLRGKSFQHSLFRYNLLPVVWSLPSEVKNRQQRSRPMTVIHAKAPMNVKNPR